MHLSLRLHDGPGASAGRLISRAPGTTPTKTCQASPLRAEERIAVSTDNRYDVIIIGTGAGGGTLAYHLAPSGKRILILERGDYVPREKGNWDPKVVNVDGQYNTKEKWQRQGRQANCIRTPITTSAATPSSMARRCSACAKKISASCSHHGGISPAWPIAYDELEPYYTQAEKLYQVHGQRGEDPTEPPASAPYPYPAVSHEPRIQQLRDDFAALGLKPFHVPLGVMLDEKDPHKSRCIRCNTCDGFPCLVHAKADAAGAVRGCRR